MRQLSGLDAAFLAMEDADGVCGHVGSVCVLDPSTAPEPLTLQRLRRHLAERSALVPLMRERLHGVPFGLGQPYWLADRPVDVEAHVTEIALPAPGDERTLAEAVAAEHAVPLDRSRPLWEIHLVTGLTGGRVAVYTKIHHAAMDGVSGDDVLAALVDRTPDASDRADLPGRGGALVDLTEEVPSSVGLLARTAGHAAAEPVRLLRTVVDLARHAGPLASAVSDRLPSLERLPGLSGLEGLHPHDATLPHPPLQAPRLPFNAPVSAARSFGTADLDLDVVRVVKARVGGTVNDVVMAVTAGALRRWLVERDVLPDGPLVAAVPVSLHPGPQPGSAAQGAGADGGNGSAAGASGSSGSNALTMMFAMLPTQVADPAARLEAAVAAMRLAKSERGAVPESLLTDVTALAPPVLASPAWRVAATLRLLERVSPFNLFVSNVPGPRVPLYYAGARLLRYYPVSAVSHGQGLNVTVVGYERTLGVGVLACRDLVPDADRLAAWFPEELALLADAVGPAAGG